MSLCGISEIYIDLYRTLFGLFETRSVKNNNNNAHATQSINCVFDNLLPQNVKFNSLPNHKIIDLSKAFPDQSLNVDMVIGLAGRKGENAGYQQFLLFLQCLGLFGKGLNDPKQQSFCKQKMVTSICSIFHNVFYHYLTNPAI